MEFTRRVGERGSGHSEYPGIVPLVRVKKLIRLDSFEYKSQPGCGVSKTLYKTRLIYAKVR